MPRPTVPAALLDPVVACCKPRRVILFGSHARGDATPDSDFDPLVVVGDDTAPERVTLRAGFEARRSYHGATDVIPVRESVFQRNARSARASPAKIGGGRARGCVSAAAGAAGSA